MAGVFPEPEISPLLVVRIGGLPETVEGEENIPEESKALAGEEGTVAGEQQRQEEEQEPRPAA